MGVHFDLVNVWVGFQEKYCKCANCFWVRVSGRGRERSRRASVVPLRLRVCQLVKLDLLRARRDLVHN